MQRVFLDSTVLEKGLFQSVESSGQQRDTTCAKENKYIKKKKETKEKKKEANTVNTETGL